MESSTPSSSYYPHVEVAPRCNSDCYHHVLPGTGTAVSYSDHNPGFVETLAPEIDGQIVMFLDSEVFGFVTTNLDYKHRFIR